VIVEEDKSVKDTIVIPGHKEKHNTVINIPGPEKVRQQPNLGRAGCWLVLVIGWRLAPCTCDALLTASSFSTIKASWRAINSSF
jgi:hypothetical protein